ncbi:MAG: host attachment protein [Propylenella sp.]
MKIERDAWVLVADGRKALITQNEGSPFEPKLAVRRVLEAAPNPPTREQGTDRPGRSHDSTSPGRSAVQQTDWHARAETEFAKTVAEALGRLCQAEDVRRLVLIAAPRTLADLRAALPPAVKNRTVSEVGKDLTNHPITEVEKILAAL